MDCSGLFSLRGVFRPTILRYAWEPISRGLMPGCVSLSSILRPASASALWSNAHLFSSFEANLRATHVPSESSKALTLDCSHSISPLDKAALSSGFRS